jgi:hypothetical protein
VLVWLILHVDLLYFSFYLLGERGRGSLRGVVENARFDKNDGTEMDLEVDPIFVIACACARGREAVREVRASTAGLTNRADLCIFLVDVVCLQVRIGG